MHRTLVARHDCFALTRPFRISRGEKIATDVVTVQIGQDGHVGRGEGVPYARYGESIDSALAQIAQVREAVAAGAGREALLDLLPPGAARNAIDCALWDLEARLGRPSPATSFPPIASALTIVIDTPHAMARAAADVAGVPLLKVKVDARAPEDQLRAVRAAAPGPGLIVDPNESWDEAIVRRLAPLLIECRADLLEQPVPAQNDEWLAGYRSPVPICADEAVHVLADLDRIATRYDAVNVKLDKSGGLTAALQLAQGARARGLGLMTGCMVSSSLSIAPALRIARVSDWVDLDGPLWLREDRPGGVRDRAGWLDPPQEGFWG